VEQLVVSLSSIARGLCGDANEIARNGDKDWTAGPPATDAVFKIQKIVMYYNPGS